MLFLSLLIISVNCFLKLKSGFFPLKDTISLSGASTADASEIDRLQQQLASAENAHAILSSTMGSLEQERQRAEQSVWISQGELSAIQEQLKASMADFNELQKQYTVLEMRCGHFEETLEYH